LANLARRATSPGFFTEASGISVAKVGSAEVGVAEIAETEIG
jgi:hypothetical protein